MWWRELDEVENECISHNFSLFAIFLPKLSKFVEIWRSSDKNNFAQFFETRCTYNWKLTGIVNGLSNGSNGSDLEWNWRSFIGRRSFQMQSVEHLCCTLHDFNWQYAREVPCVSWASCLIRTRSFRARDTIFGGFCDHNQGCPSPLSQWRIFPFPLNPTPSFRPYHSLPSLPHAPLPSPSLRSTPLKFI